MTFDEQCERARQLGYNAYISGFSIDESDKFIRPGNTLLVAKWSLGWAAASDDAEKTRN